MGHTDAAGRAVLSLASSTVDTAAGGDAVRSGSSVLGVMDQDAVVLVYGGVRYRYCGRRDNATVRPGALVWGTGVCVGE